MVNDRAMLFVRTITFYSFQFQVLMALTQVIRLIETALGIKRLMIFDFKC